MVLPKHFRLIGKLLQERWSTSCGFGHSSIITSGEFVITMEQVGENESIIARNLDNGTEAWKVTEPTRWHDMLSGTGPRSTPTLHNGKIYALFSNGRLSRYRSIHRKDYLEDSNYSRRL